MAVYSIYKYELPTSDNEAVAEMFRNHWMVLAMEKGENEKAGNSNVITIEEGGG